MRHIGVAQVRRRGRGVGVPADRDDRARSRGEGGGGGACVRGGSLQDRLPSAPDQRARRSETLHRRGRQNEAVQS